MSCLIGAQASICPPKAPSSFEKHPRNVSRPPLQVGSRSGRSQKSAFSPKTSRFLPLILAHEGSASLTPPRSSYLLSSPNRVLTYTTAVRAATRRLRLLLHPIRLSTTTVSSVARVLHATEGHYIIGVRERCTWRNRPDTTKLPPLVNQPAESDKQTVGVICRG